MKSLTIGFICILVDKYQLFEELGASIYRVEETKTAVVLCPNYNRKSTRCCFICPSVRRWDNLKLLVNVRA